MQHWCIYSILNWLEVWWVVCGESFFFSSFLLLPSLSLFFGSMPFCRQLRSIIDKVDIFVWHIPNELASVSRSYNSNRLNKIELWSLDNNSVYSVTCAICALDLDQCHHWLKSSWHFRVTFLCWVIYRLRADVCEMNSTSNQYMPQKWGMSWWKNDGLKAYA